MRVAVTLGRGRSSRRKGAVLAAAVLGVGPFAAADTWDRGAGTGLWSSNNNWADNTEPTAADPVIFPTPIPGGFGSISLTGTEQAANLTFNDDYSLGGNFLQLNAAGGPVFVAAGKIATITSSINVNTTVGLSKTGTGTLVLNPTSSNNFSGDVSITGTLSINKDLSLGNSANDVLIGAGATTGTLVTTLSLTTPSTRVISPGILGGTISANSGTTFTMNGALGGASNPLTFSGGGTVRLIAASTRSGSTSIQNGTVRIDNATALGSGGTTVANNGTFEIAPALTTGAFISLGQAGTVRSTGAGAAHNGTISVQAAATVNLNSGDSDLHSLTVGDIDGGAGSSAVVGGLGSVILSGAGNNFSGQWVVNTGSLRLAHVDAITTSSSPVIIGSGGAVVAETASNYPGGWTVGGLLRVQNATGTGVGASAIDVNSGGTLEINGVNLARNVALNNGGIARGVGGTASGTITAAASAPNLTLATSGEDGDHFTVNDYAGGLGSTTHTSGDGQIILPNANTYAGNWEVGGGSRLRVQNANALGTGTSAVLLHPFGGLTLDGVAITRNVTMSNNSTLFGINGATNGRSNGTLSILPGADVLFESNPNHVLIIGDSTNDLTGGGAGSTITVRGPGTGVALGGASNYVGNWIVQNSSIQPVNDNRFGDLGNTVTLDSGAMLSFSSFTTSRQFTVTGVSALQVFGGQMTFNTGLAGAFDTLQTSGDGVVLNAAGTVTGNAVLVDGVLKMNHSAAVGSVPFQVFGGSGVLELGTGVTLSQAATVFNGSRLRGNNNSTYTGVVTLDAGGDDVTLATVAPVDVFTIGNGANDLTGGGAGSVITAAGPGKIVLPHSNNVTADWVVSGGTLQIGAGDPLGNANTVTVNAFATLQFAGAFVTDSAVLLNNLGTLRSTGPSAIAGPDHLRIANAATNVFIDVPGVSDVLSVSSIVRNDLDGASSATIHLSGAGRLSLPGAGVNSGADVFSGSWEQSGGLIELGLGSGETINALGFKNGDPKQANSIRINGGTLAVNAVGSGPSTPPWLRANVTLNGGAIASTNGIDAQYGGDFVVEANSTSRVLLFDPQDLSTARSVKLVAGAAGVDNLAALTHWRANSTLIVDPGIASGGVFTIARDGGTISVAAASPTLQINEGAAVNFGGTANALAEGIKRVNVVNNSPAGFNVIFGSKDVGTISGLGNTNVAPGAELTANHVRQNRLSVDANGRANIRVNGDNSGTSVLNLLELAATGTLDLSDNDLIIDYTGFSFAATYEAMVASAYNMSGDWLGDGITSSIAAADGNFAIGIADNATLAAPFGTGQGGPLFSGQDVDLTSVLVKFTHRADINLDGLITPDDSAIFGGNYEEGGPAVWATGDLNYDGVFTPDDAAIFGGAYDESLTSLPEPGSAAVLALAGLVLAGRQRKRRRQTKSATIL